MRCLLLLLAVVQARAVTVATVGDSLADAIYLGMKLQPRLLKNAGVELMRWSRPNIGLTRTEPFDYTGWLRDQKELGAAQMCLVELGANDLQGIRVAKHKWVLVGGDTWRRLYAERVQRLVETLKGRGCRVVLWLLQPGNQRNQYLSRYHGMINEVQFAGAAGSVSAVFEIMANSDDYGPDGIHFNKAFCFKLGRAVVDLLGSWKPPGACWDCRSTPKSVSEPVLMRRLH